MSNENDKEDKSSHHSVDVSVANESIAESTMAEMSSEDRMEILRHSHNKKLKRYYKSQNQLLQSIDDIKVELEEYKEDDLTVKRVNRATLVAKITFCINFTLFVAKILAAVLSGSLSVVSSVIDSAVDLVSGVLLYWSNRAMKHANPYSYPRGRRKLEPISIVVLAVIMSLASFQVIQNCISQIISYAMYDIKCTLALTNDSLVYCGTEKELTDLIGPCLSGSSGPKVELPTIIICCVTIGTKLILYLICRTNKNSTIQALTQDNRNDILSNTSAVTFGIIGTKLWNYADPIGAMLISIYIIVQWFMTAIQQIKMLTGYTASPQMINKLTWLILNHDDRILYIDDLKAFHFGNNFLVEVDIILPAEMKIQESHDIGETLQMKIEKLSNVERAFVHVDYECGYVHHLTVM